MGPSTPIALAIALVGYLFGIALTSLGTVYRSGPARRAASMVFVLTWAAHSAALVSRAIAIGHLPLSNMAEFLIVLGWAVLTLHLVVWFRLREQAVGLLLPPIAGVATFVGFALLSEGVKALPTRHGWFLFHTTVSTIGMATLCLAFAMAVLYLVQDRLLKAKKNLRLLARLPALDSCDQIGYHAMLIGFVLLTVGIGAGVLVNNSVHERLWVPGPKQTFAVLAWLIFAAIIVSRSAFGFRGRRSAYLTITGFVMGLLTILGMTP